MIATLFQIKRKVETHMSTPTPKEARIVSKPPHIAQR